MVSRLNPRSKAVSAIWRARYGHRICFFGNIDCAYTLVYGSEADVRNEVRHLIDSATYGEGLIVASSKSAHSFVKPENFLAIIDETKRVAGTLVSDQLDRGVAAGFHQSRASKNVNAISVWPT